MAGFLAGHGPLSRLTRNGVLACKVSYSGTEILTSTLSAELTLARSAELTSASAPESTLALPTESKLISALELLSWFAAMIEKPAREWVVRVSTEELV